MKRRKFVKTTLATLPYLALGTTLPACDDEDTPILMTDKTVLIIGAGMAGLAAARYFKERNVDVIVLEAQSQVGGRLKTDRSLGLAFDEGASWIHGPNGNPVTQTERKVQVTTDQENFDADFVLLPAPLGVLKEDVITFTPPLMGGVAEAIGNLKMGTVNKFLCVWEDAFWDTELIGHASEERGKFNYFISLATFTATNALMTFSYGAYSKQTEQMTDAEIIADIL